MEEVKSGRPSEVDYVGTLKISTWTADIMLSKIHTPQTLISLHQLLLSLECTIKNMLLHIVNDDNKGYEALSEEFQNLKDEIDHLLRWALEIKAKHREKKADTSNLH